MPALDLPSADGATGRRRPGAKRRPRALGLEERETTRLFPNPILVLRLNLDEAEIVIMTTTMMINLPLSQREGGRQVIIIATTTTTAACLFSIVGLWD
jgi:hypothetical protein